MWSAEKTGLNYKTSLLPNSDLFGLWRRNPLLLPRVKSRICFAQKALYGITVLGIDGDSDAYGKLWAFAVIGNAFADTSCDQAGSLCVRLR
jgi:hypothetical protein